MSAIQQNVYYKSIAWYKKIIPFSSVLMALKGIQELPDVVTYDFFHETISLASLTKIQGSDTVGHFGVSLGQNIKSTKIKWQK